MCVTHFAARCASQKPHGPARIARDSREILVRSSHGREVLDSCNVRQYLIPRATAYGPGYLRATMRRAPRPRRIRPPAAGWGWVGWEVSVGGSPRGGTGRGTLRPTRPVKRYGHEKKQFKTLSRCRAATDQARVGEAAVGVVERPVELRLRRVGHEVLPRRRRESATLRLRPDPSQSRPGHRRQRRPGRFAPRE